MGGERLVRRKTNSIRPVVVASLLASGEAQWTLQSREGCGRAKARSRGTPAMRNQTKVAGRRQVVGDGMVGRFDRVTQGDLSGRRWLWPRAGVRGAIGARNPGNAGGAKGSRKVEAR